MKISGAVPGPEDQNKDEFNFQKKTVQLPPVVQYNKETEHYDTISPSVNGFANNYDISENTTLIEDRAFSKDQLNIHACKVFLSMPAQQYYIEHPDQESESVKNLKNIVFNSIFEKAKNYGHDKGASAVSIENDYAKLRDNNIITSTVTAYFKNT
ncbi:MAG: hypothetical protein ACQESE_02350 [Nanobdellota archaeon]